MRFDLYAAAGIVVVIAALAAGIALTRIHLAYFFQPTGALIVLGGTLGVTFIAAPRNALLHSARRVKDLLWLPSANRESLVDEIMSLVRVSRVKGLFNIEQNIEGVREPFLRESLLLTLDLIERPQLQATLETKIRLKERQGEADAKVLEVAGGFAPTIGVLGTVVGLVDVLRQLSNITSVGYGIGTAFISTMYGLALANLVLLPAAQRIRARVAETFETQEMIAEGVLCIFDRVHPALVRERLRAYLREAPAR